uniref:Uncharacterized protein n=1 Tax=Arundo donax TaxID=35708 RepID=A0A0A9BCH0_ARUDO
MDLTNLMALFFSIRSSDNTYGKVNYLYG